MILYSFSIFKVSIKNICKTACCPSTGNRSDKHRMLVASGFLKGLEENTF
jgi:hypothetical protein